MEKGKTLEATEGAEIAEKVVCFQRREICFRRATDDAESTRRKSESRYAAFPQRSLRLRGGALLLQNPAAAPVAFFAAGAATGALGRLIRFARS